MSGKSPDHARLDRVVAEARRARETREQGYRERALKIYPWICGRCAREFDRTNVHQLTVHHRDHNHDHNPPDGSNWELLCLYCHDNEHQRQVEPGAARGFERWRGHDGAGDAPSVRRPRGVAEAQALSRRDRRRRALPVGRDQPPGHAPFGPSFIQR